MIGAWLALAAAAQSAGGAAAGGAPLPPAPAPTVALGTAEQRDGRCFLAYLDLIGRDPASGRIGTMFFYGRLEGRNLALNFPAVLRTAAGQIGDMRAELLRCSAELDAAAQAMRAAGTALGAAGR